MPKLDRTDKNLIGLLGQDGRASVSSLAESLEVTRPTIRSRINSLIKQGVLRIAGLIDAEMVSDLLVALVAINIESRGHLNDQVKKLSEMPQVHWAAVVTGRFDIIAEVVVSGGVKELHQFTTNQITKLGQVVHSETFVIMQAHNKWLRLPQAMGKWWNNLHEGSEAE